MATLPFGVDFRATLGFITADPTNYVAEVSTVPGSAADYPETSPQGITWGWEDALGSDFQRDRSTGVNVRVAGMDFYNTDGTTKRLRIDLPSTGFTAGIQAAFGDQAAGRGPMTVTFQENTTVFATPVNNASTGGANNYIGANGTNYASDSAWATANPTTGAGTAEITHAFNTSTIFRTVLNAGTSGIFVIASLYVRNTAGGGTVFNQSCQASTSAVATLAKRDNKSLAASVSAVGLLSRLAGKGLQSTNQSVGSLMRQTSAAKSVSAVAFSKLTRGANKAFAVNNIAIASGLASRVVLKSALASASVVATLFKSAGKVLMSTTSTVANVVLSTGKSSQAANSAHATANALKVTLRLAQAVAGIAATLSRSAGKLAIASNFTQAIIVRAVAPVRATSTVPSASATKQTAKSGQTVNVIQPSSHVSRVVVVTAQVSVAVVTSLGRVVGKLANFSMRFIATFSSVGGQPTLFPNPLRILRVAKRLRTFTLTKRSRTITPKDT